MYNLLFLSSWNSQIKKKTRKRALNSSNLDGSNGTVSKKNATDPKVKNFTKTSHNSSDIADYYNGDDFVSSIKRAKLSTRASLVESDDDDEIICLD